MQVVETDQLSGGHLAGIDRHAHATGRIQIVEIDQLAKRVARLTYRKSWLLPGHRQARQRKGGKARRKKTRYACHTASTVDSQD